MKGEIVSRYSGKAANLRGHDPADLCCGQTFANVAKVGANAAHRRIRTTLYRAIYVRSGGGSVLIALKLELASLHIQKEKTIQEKITWRLSREALWTAL